MSNNKKNSNSVVIISAIISFIVGSFFTKLLSIPVILVITSGISHSGFIK